MEVVTKSNVAARLTLAHDGRVTLKLRAEDDLPRFERFAEYVTRLVGRPGQTLRGRITASPKTGRLEVTLQSVGKHLHQVSVTEPSE